VSEENKTEMKRRRSAGDPVELNRQLNKAMERLLKLKREKDKVKQPSGQEAEQAEVVWCGPGFSFEEPPPFRLDYF
jgi:hypothetical protein